MNLDQFVEMLDGRLRKIEREVTEVSTKFDGLYKWLECRDKECKELENTVQTIGIQNAKHGVYVTLISIMASTVFAASLTYYFNSKLVQKQKEIAYVEQKK